MKKFLCFFLLLIILSSCSSNKEYAIAFDKEYVDMDEFDRVYQYMEKVFSDEKEKTFDDVSEQIIFDKLIEFDLEDKGIKIEKEDVEEYIDLLSKSLGSRDDLLKILKDKKISYDDFYLSRKYSLMEDKHFKNFEENLEYGEEDLSNFFKKNKDDIYKYKFLDVKVAFQKEANGIKEELKSDDVDIDSIIDSYNNDLFDNSYAKLNDFIDRRSSDFFDYGIADMKKNEIRIFKFDSSFHVVKMLDKLDKYEDLKDETRDLYILDKYLSYINDYGKKYSIRVNKNGISSKKID